MYGIFIDYNPIRSDCHPHLLPAMVNHLCSQITITDLMNQIYGSTFPQNIEASRRTECHIVVYTATTNHLVNITAWGTKFNVLQSGDLKGRERWGNRALEGNYIHKSEHQLRT